MSKRAKQKLPILFQKEFMWALGKLAYGDQDCLEHVETMFSKVSEGSPHSFLVTDCLDSICEEFKRREDKEHDVDPGWWGCREYGEKYEAGGYTVDRDSLVVQLDPFSTEEHANGEYS